MNRIINDEREREGRPDGGLGKDNENRTSQSEIESGWQLSAGRYCPPLRCSAEQFVLDALGWSTHHHHGSYYP